MFVDESVEYLFGVFVDESMEAFVCRLGYLVFGVFISLERLSLIS